MQPVRCNWCGPPPRILRLFDLFILTAPCTPEFRCDHPTALQFEAVPDSKAPQKGEHVWLLRVVSITNSPRVRASAEAPANAPADGDALSARGGATEPGTTEGAASTSPTTAGGDGGILTAISPSEIVDGPLLHRGVSYVPGKRGLNVVAWGSALTETVELRGRQQWAINFAM